MTLKDKTLACFIYGQREKTEEQLQVKLNQDGIQISLNDIVRGTWILNAKRPLDR